MTVRRTKIIATLGPATDPPNQLLELLNAGVDLVRLNCSHGHIDSHKEHIQAIRKWSKKTHKEIGILADLQGPKVRIGKFIQGSVNLKKDQSFVLDPHFDASQGTAAIVSVDYSNLAKDVKPNDILLLDDGKIQLKVQGTEQERVICQALTDCTLTNRKGINKFGGGLALPSLTKKDVKDLEEVLMLGVDYIAVSFVRHAVDIQQVRKLIKQFDKEAAVIAKIERKEAVEAIDSIINEADAVMVARGDLALEVGQEEVPAIQKYLIKRSRECNKAVITATQMMESMVTQNTPTRAEVSDVANAVLDGTDAIMLSAETAIGKHPHLVIKMADSICRGAEKHPIAHSGNFRTNIQFTRTDEAIAMASMYVANHFRIKAIVALTERGSTPLWMSRIGSSIPILGLSRHISTLRKMTLYRGVQPVLFDATKFERKHLNEETINLLEKEQWVEKGDYIILTKGDAIGVVGGTNALKILEVGVKY